MADLVTEIAHQACEILNSTDQPGRVLKQGYRDDPALTVASDCDAELLLHIPFNSRISRLTAIALSTNLLKSGPCSVKLFVNSPTIGFAEASSPSSKPTFAFELEEHQLSLEDPKEAVVSLPVVKFRNVHTISIFVESNQSGDEESTTVISKIQLFGHVGDSFDVASIKDVSKEDG